MAPARVGDTLGYARVSTHDQNPDAQSDRLLEAGAQEYAIEHTQIEAFEDQIGKGVSLERLVGPVKKALCGKLSGPAIYMMVFPFDRNLSVNRSNLKQHQENLKEWVRKKI